MTISDFNQQHSGNEEDIVNALSSVGKKKHFAQCSKCVNLFCYARGTYKLKLSKHFNFILKRSECSKLFVISILKEQL